MTVLTLKDTSRPRRAQDSRARLLAAARKLFVERGYDATRPQDISREAGLGHGTFYLHFADKQACFLVFVEEARAELAGHIRSRAAAGRDLAGTVRATLEGIFEYSATHPGVLDSAMANASVIASGGKPITPLIDVWADEWASAVRTSRVGDASLSQQDAALIGAAIVGIIHEGSAYARRHGQPQSRTIDLLTDLIVKSLK